MSQHPQADNHRTLSNSFTFFAKTTLKLPSPDVRLGPFGFTVDRGFATVCSAPLCFMYCSGTRCNIRER